MDRDTIVEYLSLISEQAVEWEDSKKYPFWKELLNQKEWLVHNTEDDLDDFMMKLLDSTIEKVVPTDIRYIYRRLYEPGYFDYDDEGEFHTKWEAKRNKQETAVYDIYASYGIESVVEFSKELNNEAWIAQNLGKQLNKIENEEMRTGYQLGIFNQRGVRMIDPEGKPELQLAEKYKEMSEAVESLGYAKFAETLLQISDDYTRDAEYNIRSHQLDKEAHKREEEDSD